MDVRRHDDQHRVLVLVKILLSHRFGLTLRELHHLVQDRTGTTFTLRTMRRDASVPITADVIYRDGQYPPRYHCKLNATTTLPTASDREHLGGA